MNSITLVMTFVSLLAYPTSDSENDRDRCIRLLSYGNNWVFEDQIKARLKVPNSYDFQSAKLRENTDGQIIVVWEFLASNLYGVKVRHSATGLVLDIPKCAKFEPRSIELVYMGQVK